jgi:hypothetical protein
MQTFRAYVRDAAGTITWAAWVEAAHEQEARVMANAMREGVVPTLELWSATQRKLADTVRLDPV